MSDYSIPQARGVQLASPPGRSGVGAQRRVRVGGQGAIIGKSVTITVLPLSETHATWGRATHAPRSRNRFRTGLFEADKSNRAHRPNELQHMLKMDAWQRAAPSTGDPYDLPGGSAMRPTPTGKIEPARVTTVLVKGRPIPGQARSIPTPAGSVHQRSGTGVRRGGADEAPSPRPWRRAGPSRPSRYSAGDLHRLSEAGETVVVLHAAHGDLVRRGVPDPWRSSGRWSRRRPRTSAHCARWAPAVPASRGLWLRYGLAIGFAGVVLRLIASWLLVTNVNEVHDWIQQTFHRTVWDPKVYYFSKIPNLKRNPVRGRSSSSPGCSGLLAAGGAGARRCVRRGWTL